MKKAFKIFWTVVVAIAAVLFALWLLLQTSGVQTFIARKVNLFQFAALIGKYASGHAAELTDLVTHLQGREITIEFGDENVINLDGEAYFTRRAVMRLLPGAVNLIVPKGMKFFGNEV